MHTIKNLIIFYILALSLTGCRHQAEHEKAGDKFIKVFVKKTCKNNQLSLLGYGGAFYEDIKKLGLTFGSIKEMDIDEARKLVVFIKEDLINQINANQNLREYLHNYPFDNRNVEVTICIFQKNSDQFINPPHVAWAWSADNGMVYYATYDPIKDSLESLHKESYQQAKDIIESQENTKNLLENAPCYMVP